VPNGFSGDPTEAIIAQIERFGPGFRDRIVGKTVRSTPQMSTYNPNYVGGHIMTGAKDIRQLVFGPRITSSPYKVGVQACTSAPPPHRRDRGSRDVRRQRRASCAV
jgi:phytoene dehydrogenase-like protein